MRWVVGNWKAQAGAPQGGGSLGRELCAQLPRVLPGVQVVVCPPFTALAAVGEVLSQGVRLGAQDVFWEDGGAFTGEITASMLAACGCTHVIVGHSERRRLFAETDQQVAGKLRACWRQGLQPILCVGETEEERRDGDTAAVLGRQVRAALDGSEAGPLAVAYEPVWAIGTGRAAGPEDCAAGLAVVAAALAACWGPVGDVPLLYGGSVSAENCRAFWEGGRADGALVGGASLQAGAFAAICAAAAEGEARA